jgi:hypothetical protein
MKRLLIIFSSFILSGLYLTGQINQLITVKAGTKVADYFPVEIRYRYPDFKPGKLVYTNGKFSSANFNYNLLLGEVEYIQSGDTMRLLNKKDISSIEIAQDTFFYDKGYIELIYGGRIKVGLHQYIKLKDILRKGAMGSTNRSVAIDTYNSVPLDNNLYGIVPNEDWVFQRIEEYYFSDSSGEFVPFSRRNVLQEFPEKKKGIEAYLKSDRINFNSGEDLIRLAEFLGEL